MYFFFQAEKASPTLTLSHSELTQIRSALSRAKLESLPPDLMNDIVKGNLCFLCTKTKFMLFLNRRHQCQLCQQSVCSKCISKVWTYLGHYYKSLFFVQKVNFDKTLYRVYLKDPNDTNLHRPTPTYTNLPKRHQHQPV